jgi:hypothetical protein
MVSAWFGASVWSCAVYRLLRRPRAGELCVRHRKISFDGPEEEAVNDAGDRGNGALRND